MDKYGCGNCGHTWYDNEEPTKCPKCKDWDIYPILVCEDCGLEDAKEDFPYNHLFDGMCAECFQKSISGSKIVDYIVWCVELSQKNKEYCDIDACEIVNYSYGLDLDYVTDSVAIFALLVNLYRLLYLEGKYENEKEKIIGENARDWAFDDLGSFYEWWCEYGQK